MVPGGIFITEFDAAAGANLEIRAAMGVARRLAQIGIAANGAGGFDRHTLAITGQTGPGSSPG